MKVGFVCTNYNNSAYTRGAVASLLVSGGDDVRIVVVDNKSNAADVAALEEIAREFPQVDVLLNEENVGYFPGLNLGIERLRATHPGIEHIVIGNNDLIFPENFVEGLQRHREVFDQWAVVAPDLVTPAGVHQNPHVFHPISRGRKLVWEVYYLSYGTAVLVKYLARITRSFMVREENSATSSLHKTAAPVEQGYGACYILGPVFFRNFARLFAPTFMMEEEFFLYEQLKQIGQLTYYDPRFVVQHVGHATTSNLKSRRHWDLANDAHAVYRRYHRLSMPERKALIATSTQAPA